MRVAAVQLNSTEEKDRNVSAADALVRQAAEERAELVVLPEKFNLLGTDDQLRAGAEPLDGPTLNWARTLARELEVWIVAGSIAEHVDGEEKLFNTSTLIGPEGLEAVYRKVHLFDVDVAGRRYRESDTEAPGEQLVSAHAGELPLGMSICYDLRFPELFRILAVKGARAIALPAAFTEHTGRDHWEVLVRARAIENQVFMIAAAQFGAHPPGHRSFGHSMIVDPWGSVLASRPDGEGIVVADLDLEEQDRVRESLPSLASRRPDVYRWPDAVQVGG